MDTTTTMTRTLGRSGIAVSAMGMGCWAVGGSGWGGGANDEQSLLGIRKALEMGINFFDTADAYGQGHSESILAQALEGKRDQAVIATKFSYLPTEASRQRPLGSADPQSIREFCEASLRRLKTDHIDLYQFHINDYPADQAEPVRETLEELVKAGKIRAYGWSTDFPDRARVFAQGPNCTAIQVELNVIDDAPDILAVCDEFDLAAINRGPLAMGLLTGKYTPRQRTAAGRRRARTECGGVDEVFQGRQAEPGVARQDGSYPRHPYQRRAHAGAGRAGVAVGAQSA